MTAPTPQRKANELIDSINEMLFGELNNERIEEIVATAEKMKSAGLYTDGCNVLGMIAALRGDLDEVNRIFNAAIRHGGREPFTLINYAAALNNLDQHCDAISTIDEVVEMVPDDLIVIKEAIKFHRDAFDIKGARELIVRCEALGQPFVDPEFDCYLDEAESLMIEHNVAWRDMASRISLASNALHRLGVIPRFSRGRVEDGILIHEFGIDEDVELVSRAENAMNDAIAEDHYSPIDTFLYFTCSTV